MNRKWELIWILEVILRILTLIESSPIPGPETRVVVYRMSEPAEFPLPVPPMCKEQISADAQATPTRLTLWRVLTSRRIAGGVLFSKRKVVGSCTTNWLGMSVKEIVSKIPKKVWPSDITSVHLPELVVGTTSDLSFDPQYSCSWASTQQITSIRLYASSLDVHLSERGRVFADNREWKPTEIANLWSNGMDLLQADVDITDMCAFSPLRHYQGRLYNHENVSLIFISSTGELRTVLDLKQEVARCHVDKVRLFRTDLGIPASVNTTIDARIEGSPRMPPLLSASEALFRLEVIQELSHVITRLNDNLSELDSYLCHQRRKAWADASLSNDPNQLAIYLTQDPFAMAELRNKSLFISVREKLPWDIPLDSVHLLLNDSIEFERDGVVHNLDPASGLVDMEHPRSRLMPPVVELSIDKMLDLRTQRVETASGVRWIHSDLTLKEFNLTFTEVSQVLDSTNLLSPPPEEYESFWDKFSHWILIPTGVAGIIVGIVLLLHCQGPIRRFFCARCGIPPAEPDSHGRRSPTRPTPPRSSRAPGVRQRSRRRSRSVHSRGSRSSNRPLIGSRARSSPRSPPMPTPPVEGWQLSSMLSPRPSP